MHITDIAKRVLNTIRLIPSMYKYGGVTHISVSTIDYHGSLFSAHDVALVTGGSSGIGFEIARRLIEEGATVIITGRSTQKLDEARFKINSDRLHTLEWDISDVRLIPAKMEEAEHLVHKPITILINNAGTYSKTHFPHTTSEDWDTVYLTNLKGLYFLTQHFVNDIIKLPPHRGIRKIINIASQGGMVAANNAYRMTKWDIRGFTKHLGIAYASEGIIANAIAPGIILTDMQPQLKQQGDNIYSRENPTKRVGLPVEIAELAIFLASSASNYIVGETICCDGGYNIK